MDKIKQDRSTIICYLIFFGVLVLFITLSLLRINQTVADDDLTRLVPAVALYSNTRSALQLDWLDLDKHLYDHPPLYFQSMVLMFKLFGPGARAARLVGIISGVLSIILVFLIVKLSCQGKDYTRIRLATAVSALYALAPSTIQGALIIQIDNTVLVPAVLFLFWGTIKYFQEKKFIWLGLVSIATALSLWARLSTPLVIILLLISYVLLSKNTAKIKFMFISSLIFGVLIFVFTWYLYCKADWPSFLRLFGYTLESVGEPRIATLISQLLQNTLYLTLWLVFFFLLLIIFVIWKNYNKLFSSPQIYPQLMFFCGVILTMGFCIFGKASFGYPKYHMPAIPLLYIGTALLLSREYFAGLHFKKIAVFLFIALFIQLFAIGDLLYIFRYTLREYLTFNLASSLAVLKNASFRIIISLIVYGLLFLIFSRLFPGKAIIGLLVIFCVISNLSLTFLQSIAGYNTGFNYGEEGIAKTAEYIREKIPQNTIVIGPREIIYYMRLLNSPYLPNSFWSNADAIEKRLHDPRVSAFIYSITTNTIEQIKTVSENPSIQKLLCQKFDYIKIGTYDIWIRKGGQR